MNERFGLSHKQRRYTLYVAGLMFALAAFNLTIGAPPYIFVVAGVIWLLGYFVLGAYGVTLDASGVHMRGLTRQHVPWHRIASVEEHGTLGTETVKLRLVDGRSKRLRAPIDGPLQSDPEFGAKVETLREWHRQHTAEAT